MRDTAAGLLERGQHAGAAAAEISSVGLLTLVNAIALAGPGPGQIGWLMHIVRHGTVAR